MSATSAHDPWKLEEVRVGGLGVGAAFGRCEACHTLDPGEGETGTSYISSTARTIQWNKLYKGGGAFALADNLACTFCHSAILDNIYMEDALQEFDAPTIKHPMGRKIDGTTNTNNEWVSTLGTATVADELQCTECHTTTLLTYPYHEGRTTDPAPWTGTWDKTVNPNALQNVTVAGDGDKKHCVDTCHGNAVSGGNGPTKPLMGHYTYGNFNGTTIYDPSGQAMQVAGAVCVTCHDTHSSTEVGLIQDGLKRGAADPGRTAINPDNCTTVCHATGAFNSHGHGQYPIFNSTTCYNCHVSSIRHRDQTDDASRRRMGYNDPAKSSLTMNRAANGLDDDMDGLRDEADEATFSYSKTSNCKTCHINYLGHGNGASSAACLDCHDMHGDSAAVNNNAAMMRSSIMGENTVFTAADRAAGRLLYDANTNGLCDNDSCHSNISGNLATAHLGGAITESANCAGCHVLGAHPTNVVPGDGFGDAVMNCNGCHSSPPVGSDTPQLPGIVAAVDHSIRTRGGVAGTSTDVNFYAAHDKCSICHGVSNNATDDGFANAVTATGGKDAYAGHLNNSVNMNGISVPDNNANANYTAATGGCAKACHASNWTVGYLTAPTVFPTTNPIVLQEYGSGACSGCHGNTVSGAYWPDNSANTIPTANNAGRHPRHMTVLAARLGITLPGTDAQQKQMCDYCHQTSTGNDGDHAVAANLPAEVFPGVYRKSLWNAADADAAYVPATDVCNNVDCHAGRQTTDGTYGWYDAGVVGTTGCAMCHDVAPATGKHVGHLASNALPGATAQDECLACHDTTMNTATTPDTPLAYSTTNLHVNGVNNVAFDVLYDYEAAGGTGTAGSALTTTCSDIRCHNGVTTPTWGAAGITCGQCHNNGAGDPAPTMTASVAGSHAAHIDGTPSNYTDCDGCHGALGITVSGTYSATGGGGAGNLHQNLVVNMWINGANNRYDDVAPAPGDGAGGVNYLAADTNHVDSGRCSTTICHGAATPDWGGALANGCFDCHTGAEANAKPLVDAIPNPVTLAGQYNTYGHGRPTASGNYPGSGNPPANYLWDGVTNNCYSCHDSGAPHAPAASATDPYRLGANAQNTNAVCDACHLTGPATVINVQEHTKTITGSSKTWPGTNYDYKCVDCHDPHGDANYMMVRSHLSAPQTTVDTTFGSDNYGTPLDGASVQAVTFNNVTTGMAAGAYGITGIAADGICEVCHTQTTYWRKDVAQEAHNPGSPCTGCHSHSEGFKPSGCDTCHGGNNPGQVVVGTNFYPDSDPSAAYADREGAHLEHVTAIATARGSSVNDSSTCLVCHPNPGGGSNHQPGTGAGDFANAAEVWNDGHGAWTVGSFGNLSTDGVDANGAYNHTTNTCSNVDCHGGTTTPDWYSPGFVDTTPPYWPSGDGLTAADSTTGGEVVVSWSAATDAASLPIRYDLYRNATCTGAPIATATNLVATSFTDTGLTNNILYNYCVRAKDAWTPYVEANNSVISTTPTSATPTLTVWTGGTANMTYKLVSTTTAVSLGGISTGVKVCGTRLNGSWPTTWPAFYTGLLVPDATNYTCGTATTQNAVLSNVSQTGPRFGVQHFLQNAYTEDKTVTGQNNAAGFDIYIDAGSTSATMLTYFARLSPAGVIDQTVGPLGSSSALSTAVSRETANPQTLSITVPAGYRFGVVVGTNETTGSTAAPLLSLDRYNATVTNNASVMVNESTPDLSESTPPVFSGPLTAVDAASGGTVNLSWPAGTDTSLPIRYRVWWSTGAINYGAAPNATTTATQLTASGLTNGVLHNFGVRAVDAQNNLNTTQITATATPTAAPVATDCYACHTWPQTSGAHTTHKATTNPLISNTVCTPCHGNLSGYTTAHSNGVLDLPGVAYSGEPTPGVLNGTCSSVSCHYGSATPAWNSTGLLNCTSCHQYPPATLAGAPGYSDHDAGLVMAGGVTEFKNAHNDCMGCHGVKSATTNGLGAMVTHANYPASMHGDGSVTMNGPDATPGPIAGTEYVDGSGWCAYACHVADANHSITPSTFTPNVNYGDFGLGACNYCHETGTFGAPAVPAAGAHAGSCDQCHPLHKVKDATKQVLIPNNTGVGINYTTHTGIFLGGTGTKSSGWATVNTPTEAEICWGCHDTQGISEWGVNNNAQTGSQAYDYGSLSTSNWRTATWTSGTALFSYKTAPIQSTHAAATAGGAVKGIDPLAAIRCSYCHDVHDRNLAAGDTTSGQPYLRGSWRGNPYPEDGAPQTGSSYPAYNATTNYWGAVPRGGPVAGTATGGYYIDQNSGNPVVTAGWTATQYGGLCDLCHGTTKNGVFTSAEVNVLNQYDTAGVGWVSGTNGHVNSVGVAASGGGSHNATATTGGLNNQGNNIFAGRGGANNQTSSAASHPFMLFNGTSMPGDSAGGFRGVDSQFGFTPAMGARPMDGDGWVNTQWNNLAGRSLALTGTTVDPLFHSFSCSKCHNPHASRLPALMITNCLDTKHNAWDNGFQLNTATDALAVNRAISNWTSAQNCHRLGGVDSNAASPTYDSRGDVMTVTTTPGNAGWNTVTPWQR